MLRDDFARIRSELGLPVDFPPDVVAAAREAAHRPLPAYEDATGLAMLTIDPVGSLDLDQAMHIARRGSGYRVSYAIADVAHFVDPGGPIDVEAQARVETLYGPDARIPLHPPELSEGAASLLPGEVRPALLWTLDLDAAGELVRTQVGRRLVRSQERLDYITVQRSLDDGTADERLTLLREVGTLRQTIERRRGGIDLGLPEQEVVALNSGWTVQFRARVPVEAWNAQISLLTGIAAARLMIDGRIGVLRTMPPPGEDDVARLRRTAVGLGIEWPTDLPYAELLRSLDPRRDQHAAFLNECTVLLRGAGYTAFDGDVPAATGHSAVAAPYAHATAPLRRLVDRYVGEVCVALCAGTAVPTWAREMLPLLPARMSDGDRRASALERASVDLVEAAVLSPYVGRTFKGVVVDHRDNHDGGVVQVARPAVLGRCSGVLPLGQRISVRLVEADVSARRVRFERVAD
jgi:exoribonuclease R